MARVICCDPTGKNCNCKYCKENKRKARIKEWVNGKIEDSKQTLKQTRQ